MEGPADRRRVPATVGRRPERGETTRWLDARPHAGRDRQKNGRQASALTLSRHRPALIEPARTAPCLPRATCCVRTSRLHKAGSSRLDGRRHDISLITACALAAADHEDTKRPRSARGEAQNGIAAAARIAGRIGVVPTVVALITREARGIGGRARRGKAGGSQSR